MSKTTNKFSPEVRERAVRMVREHRDEYPSRWAYIHSSESPRLTLSLEFGTPPLGPGSKPDPRHLSPAAVSERRTSLTSERVPR